MHTYCKDFKIKVRLSGTMHLTVDGSLSGIHATPPKAAKPSLVSPDEKHEPMRQVYIPESMMLADTVPASKLYTYDQCDRAVVIKDKNTDEVEVTLLPKEALDATKESDLPKNIMYATVHTAEEADAKMFPMKDAQSYVFYPHTNDPDNLTYYLLLQAIVDRSNLAFVSIVNLQGHEGLYRLGVWRERLILVKQGFPELIVPHTFPTEGEFEAAQRPDDEYVDHMIANFRAKMVETIEPTTYTDRVIAEKVALKEAVDNGEVIPEKTETAAPKHKMDVLADLLAAFEDD